MKLACNWSNELLELLTEDNVRIDFIKAGVFGDFNKRFTNLRETLPILLHGLGHFERSGMHNLDFIDYTWANQLIAQCGSPHYGLHLGITNTDIDTDMTEEDINNRMVHNICFFKKCISVPLLLENTPDCPHDRIVFDHYPYIDAHLISSILQNTQTFFLLDLAHATVTARYRGWNIHEYLQALPLSLVREIHVIGSGYNTDGYPRDTHEPMKDEDYALLEWVLRKTKPHVVTLEYGGSTNTDKTILQEQLSKLAEIVY